MIILPRPSYFSRMGVAVLILCSLPKAKPVQPAGTPKVRSLCADSEKAVFAFETRNKKQAAICEGDSPTEYLVYRFGTPGKIELEFPASKDSSFSKFEYRFYMRGGGAENLDMNYLGFEIGSVKYELFEEWGPDSSSPEIGIEVRLKDSKKPKRILGVAKSRRGNLLYFRGDERVRQAGP